METQTELTKQLIDKAEEDTNFRARLLADPNAALKEAFGVNVPAEFSIVVHEDNARTAHLVLPAPSELNDAQLQRAAGGGKPVCAPGKWE